LVSGRTNREKVIEIDADVVQVTPLIDRLKGS
jgi:uncharacterized protein YggU (UPF0235/DUF167 family)